MLPLGFKFERTIDKRAPFGWAAADVVEKIVVCFGTYKAVPRSLEKCCNFNERMKVIGPNCNKMLKIS